MSLTFVLGGEPVIHRPARPLERAEILSREVQELIERMRESLRGRGVGLAAPQVGYGVQLIVVEDLADQAEALPREFWDERERRVVPFQVIINPRLTETDSASREFFEACLSLPGVAGLVPRVRGIRVECLNEQAVPVVVDAVGWHARILQHEIDHLGGRLFTERALPRSLMNIDVFSRSWRSKPIAEVKAALRF